MNCPKTEDAEGRMLGEESKKEENLRLISICMELKQSLTKDQSFSHLMKRYYNSYLPAHGHESPLMVLFKNTLNEIGIEV